jgi:hypothetical protein
LVSIVRELSDSPYLNEVLKDEADQFNRIHQRLKGNFDRVAKLLPELTIQGSKSQALIVAERVANVASEIVCSITWVEEFGLSLADGLTRIASGAAIEVVDESDEEAEEDKGNEDIAQAGRSMRLRLLNSSAALRAAMRMLIKADSEQGPQTVVDLLAAFSSPSVYVTAGESSETLVTPSETAAAAIGIVLDVMQEARRSITSVPPMKLGQLERWIRCGGADTPGEAELSPKRELLSTGVPLKLSSEGDGVVRFSLDLPDIVLNFSSEPIQTLFRQLGRKDPILRALGTELTWSSKSRGARVHLSCDLRLPGSYGQAKPICDDSSVITSRDMAILSDVASGYDGHMLSVRVRDSEEEREMIVMMLSSALDLDSDRLVLERILRPVRDFARGLGGTRISFIPNSYGQPVDEGYSEAPFLVLIQGEFEGSLNSEDVLPEQSFCQSHRYLERWDPKRRAADDFVEATAFSEPYVLVPSFVFEEEKMLSDMIALSTDHHLRSFDLSQFELDSETFSGLLSRLRRELDVSLRAGPQDAAHRVSVECVDPELHPIPEIRFLRTDENYALYASGRIGVVHDTTTTHTYPLEAMRALVQGVREVLAELWPKRRLTAGDLQIALRGLGCQVSNSLATSIAEMQIRKDELMSVYEVSSIIIRLLVDDEDQHILEMNRDGYNVMMLTHTERRYLNPGRASDF